MCDSAYRRCVVEGSCIRNTFLCWGVDVKYSVFLCAVAFEPTANLATANLAGAGAGAAFIVL